jgi:bifunctional non-homologous end joining protein LigD
MASRVAQLNRGSRGKSATTLRQGRQTSSTSAAQQLDAIERAGGDGTVQFGRHRSLHVSSLDKAFFPTGITKGDLMRYYAVVADVLLPITKDRPLILKRFPDGVGGPSFFQQNAGDHVPAGVRVADVETEGGARGSRIIGGDLLTLLYTVQIGTIAVHTWQTRIHNLKYADTTTIDLDPGDDVPFREVVALARVIKAELDALDLSAAVKTSGSSGLHIVLPLPSRTSFETAARVAEAIAARVVDDDPKRATIERSIRARPRGAIYIDAQQNAAGKSVVAAYSVRERRRAAVSAPLDWAELRGGLRLDRFRVETMPDRIRDVGDLWGAAMERRNSKRALDRVLHDAPGGR